MAILGKLQNVLPANTMVSHVNDLFLVVETGQDLQFRDDVIQHDAEGVGVFIVVGAALSQISTNGLIE